MSKSVLRFRNLNIEKQAGELGRLRALGGPDHGLVFILTAARTTIGRGEENDLVLTDLKMSRKHLEIGFGQGGVVVRDLGSSNGFMINGVLQKQAALKSGDKIGVGESVLEFIANEAGATQMITMPVRPTVKAVGTGTSGLTQFIQKSGAPSGDDDAGLLGMLLASKKPSGAAAVQGAGRISFIERNKKVLFLLGGLMLVAGLLPQAEQRRAKRRAYVEPLQEAAAGDRAVSSLKPPPVDDATRKASEVYSKEGFRELRAGNYLRAEVSFETALQVYPDNVTARIYLETTKKQMEVEAKNQIDAAKRDEEANRLSSARSHYESVSRLYLKDQTNPLYKEAQTREVELDKKIKDQEAEQ